jgi:hypothetical protein
MAHDQYPFAIVNGDLLALLAQQLKLFPSSTKF